jgi:hypothetical protein
MSVVLRCSSYPLLPIGGPYRRRRNLVRIWNAAISHLPLCSYAALPAAFVQTSQPISGAPFASYMRSNSSSRPIIWL